MRHEHLAGLTSPATGLDLHVQSVRSERNGAIEEGTLVDASRKHVIQVQNFIPRFVSDGAYANSFGEQWNRYQDVQIDNENGLTLSAERFYEWTGWRKEELRGQRILEAGCGAGRFTQVMLDAGATVYSFDMSSAADACWRTNAPNDRLCVMQADIYDIPCKKQFFDQVFCYGVLQHTPDPRRAFLSLVPYLRAGGKIAVDCYMKLPYFTRWTSKYLWRWLTTRLPPSVLCKAIEWYIPKWLPLDTRLAAIPRIGHRLVGIVPCWNYTGLFPLSSDQIEKWAILDTFDALASKYDYPQTVDEVRRWFHDAKLQDVQVGHGSNGIVGSGTLAVTGRCNP